LNLGPLRLKTQEVLPLVRLKRMPEQFHPQLIHQADHGKIALPLEGPVYEIYSEGR